MEIVSKALDLYSRVLCGDLNEAIDVYRMEVLPDYDHEFVELYMDMVCRELTRLPINASLGIFNKQTPENAKIAYEIEKAIENKFYYEQPEPRRYSVHSRIVNDLTKEPIVKIQKTFEVLKMKLKRKLKKYE